MEKFDFKGIIAKYLEDDGNDRDIVKLANSMGFEVYITYSRKEFVALTKCCNDSRLIILNKSRVNDEKLLKFILSYQLVELAEFINYEGDVFYSKFVIEQLDIDIYNMAQLILERTDRYKDSSSKPMKKVFNKKYKMEA